MELASGLTHSGNATLLMAATAPRHTSVVRHQMAANHCIPDLCPDGLGHMGVAGATLGADAAAKLDMGIAALGAQPDPDDPLRTRAAPLALRMEEAGRRLQV